MPSHYRIRLHAKDGKSYLLLERYEEKWQALSAAKKRADSGSDLDVHLYDVILQTGASEQYIETVKLPATTSGDAQQ